MDWVTNIIAISSIVVFMIMLLLMTSKLFIVSQKIDRIAALLSVYKSMDESDEEKKSSS